MRYAKQLMLCGISQAIILTTEPAWATDQYFHFWFRFRRDIRILVSKKLARRNIILRGVKKML